MRPRTDMRPRTPGAPEALVHPAVRVAWVMNTSDQDRLEELRRNLAIRESRDPRRCQLDSTRRHRQLLVSAPKRVASHDAYAHQLSCGATRNGATGRTSAEAPARINGHRCVRLIGSPVLSASIQACGRDGDRSFVVRAVSRYLFSRIARSSNSSVFCLASSRDCPAAFAASWKVFSVMFLGLPMSLSDIPQPQL
jgi:hypothetical protein